MDKADADSLKQEGIQSWKEGKVAAAWMSDRAWKAFDKMEARQRGRLSSVAERWSNNQSLTEEMINVSEGRTSKNKVMIQAFKAFKARLYGFDWTFRGSRIFFIVDADTAKKQNKADATILDRAKKRADNLIDRLKGKESKNGQQ